MKTDVLRIFLVLLGMYFVVTGGTTAFAQLSSNGVVFSGVSFTPDSAQPHLGQLVSAQTTGTAIKAQAIKDATATIKKPLKLVFFNSESPQGSHWWTTSSDMFEESCRQLGMKSEVIYVNRDRMAMLEKFKTVAQSADKPDAVIFQNLRQDAVQMLAIAEKYNLKAFIFNAGLTEAENIAKYKEPREYFKNWVGQMLPDDRQAGYNLAKVLYQRAKDAGLTGENGRIRFVCLNGPISDTASIERLKGLNQAAAELPNISIIQIVHGEWTEVTGYERARVLINRYPELQVLWCANDRMAMGAMTALKEAGMVPGKNVLLGSVDWSPDALAAVNANELVCSIGGHFMDSAWSVILLYDYFNGRDFKDEAVSFHSKMEILDRRNIDAYLKYFKPENFSKIDFLQFSKVKNPALKKYNFNFDAILAGVSGKAVQP